MSMLQNVIVLVVTLMSLNRLQLRTQESRLLFVRMLLLKEPPYIASQLKSMSLLKFLINPKEVMTLCFKTEEKSRNELKQISLKDHNWSLKS
jgi:hypothetical protein